jgi:DNA-binding XRE family transcriptional regulator
MIIPVTVTSETSKVVMAWKQQLGDEIANARRKARMTQEELRRAVGVSRNTIVSYEKGNAPPPFETLASIARAVNADQFVVEDLHITFSRNGAGARPDAVPQQLKLEFDKEGGVTVRIESAGAALLIKALSA